MPTESGDSTVHYFPEQQESPSWIISKQLRALSIAFMAVSIAVTLLIRKYFGMPSSVSEDWSKFLGMTALVMSVFQFVPQIWRTWKYQEVGALSIKAMLMQTPGSFLMCYTIAVSPETNIYTWITYFVGGCLQGCLLLLCISLNRKDPHILHRYERLDSDIVDDNE